MERWRTCAAVGVEETIMAFIDSRSYRDNRQMFKNIGKSEKWMKGYDAAWEGKPSPPSTASPDYVEGYDLGVKDRERENLPPHIRDGFTSGHGFDRSAGD